MADGKPQVRAILLGASNLRIALPGLLSGLIQQSGGPVEAFAACGHGRSYGTWSRFLFLRHLPGITQCGLWPALAVEPARKPDRVLSLLTDPGNDLAYGASPAETAGWIGACLDRLADQEAETILTLLPLARLARLKPWQARLAATLLYPGHPIPWPGFLDRARDLDDRLRRLALVHGARLVEPGEDWYGKDPIHLRRGAREEVWNHVLSLWYPAASPPRRGPRPRLPWPGAETVRLGPFRIQVAQPVLRLAEDSSLALY